MIGEFTKRTGNHYGHYAPYGEFATNDGNIVIAVTKDEEWASLILDSSPKGIYPS